MFGLGRRRDAARIVDDIRQTITRLDEQRRLATDVAGRALVNQAEVKRACTEQLRTLSAAFGVAEDGETLARRAARGARRDADADIDANTDANTDADAFEQTAAGLQAVQQALGAAAEPIHGLLAGAGDHVDQARQVLVRAREVLDEQIREQLRLLRVLEQAERARIVAETRRRR